MPELLIREDDLTGTPIQELLTFHQKDALAKSPPGTSYALDLSGLQGPEITLWSAWIGSALAGCAALKHLNTTQAEIKSMRTAPAFMRQGVASRILVYLIQVARERNYRTLYLETGTNEAYVPAVALYEKHGFARGPAYGDYVNGPHNQCYHLSLA
jgi:putative acetyltransferase